MTVDGVVLDPATMRKIHELILKREQRYMQYTDTRYHLVASGLRVLAHDIKNGMFRG